ncbi:NMD3 family protein [uncultured archaeon]|nr:NMD3 family protein [uncultured archaeon]
MARYCPICGKSDEKVAFHGELCMDCARERVPQFPNVHVGICQKCGEVIDKGRKKKEMTIEEEISRILKIKQQKPVYAPEYKSVEYDTPYGRISQDILVLFDKNMCVDCARSGSQYFEAIIQLRDNPDKVERMAERLIKRISSRSFVPKIEELKEGIDIYCGSRNEAIAALNSQQLGYLRTEKLAGEKNGKRLYRTTLLVRL